MPPGEQAERDVRADERGRDGAHGAVATEGGDDVGAGSTASRPCFSPVSSAVVSIQRRLVPAVLGAGLAHELLGGVEVVDLDGVVDDGQAAASAGRVGRGVRHVGILGLEA